VDLQGLAIAFSDGLLRVFEEDGGFLLEAEQLEHLTHRSEVKPAAERIITRLNGAMRLGSPSYQNASLSHVRERRADGTEEISVFVEAATLRIRSSVQPVRILGGVPTQQLPDPARTYIATAAADPDADDALDLWANEPHDWVNLYKVFEIIRARGGLDRGVSESELRRFTHTANHEEAAGRQARHARLGADPPNNPMTPLEADHLIRRLLEAWLQSLA
jgi:hypothetical protein